MNSSPDVEAAAPARERPRLDPSRWRWAGRWAGGVSLLLLAAATRLPLWGASQGEPDSARFVIEAWQWIHYGPHPNPHVVAYAYYPVLAPAYFVLAQALVRWFHTGAAGMGGMLNGLSVVVSLASAPLLYDLGRRFLPPPVAWTAALLFLLSPGYWWLGIEAHPQGIAFLLLLVGFDLWLLAQARGGHARRILLAATAAALGLALLFRGDAFLLWPLLLVLRPHPVPGWMRLWPNVFLAAGGVAAAAGIAFLGERARILQTTVAGTQASSVRLVARFLGHSSLLHQALPLLTAPGPAVCGFSLVGLWWLWRGRALPFLRPGLGLVLAVAPGLGFWLLVTGNNVRHVTDFWLPLLWAGCLGWWRRRPGALLPAALVCLALNWAILPPNSNTTLYPSPNVVASHRMVARQQMRLAELAAQLHRQAAAGAPASCFLGGGATPFVLESLVLAPSPPAMDEIDPAWVRVRWPGTAAASTPVSWVGEVYSDHDFALALRRCPAPLSVEYAVPNRHLWYAGAELGRLSWFAAAERWAHRLDMRHQANTLRLPAN